MYAVIESGGKQYRVQPGDTIRVDRLTGDPGAEIEIGRVLAVSRGEDSFLTGSDVGGAKVKATIRAHGRGDKILVFKFKRKKQYKRTIGHRHDYTELAVGDIVL